LEYLLAVFRSSGAVNDALNYEEPLFDLAIAVVGLHQKTVVGLDVLQGEVRQFHASNSAWTVTSVQELQKVLGEIPY
jgi:hypothetical protein